MRMPPLRINPIKCRSPTPVDNHTATPMNAMVRRLPARTPFTNENVLLAGGVAGAVCSIAAIKVNQNQVYRESKRGDAGVRPNFYICDAGKSLMLRGDVSGCRHWLVFHPPR